jgi:hypothetical protein
VPVVWMTMGPNTNFVYQLAIPNCLVVTLNFAMQQMIKIARCKFKAITCDQSEQAPFSARCRMDGVWMGRTVFGCIPVQ